MNGKKLAPLFISILIAIIIGIMCFITFNYRMDYDMVLLDEGWDVEINGTLYENVTLSKFYKSYSSTLLKGDHIIMSIDLPTGEVMPNSTIAFRSRYTSLTCYIDDEVIYDFGRQLIEQEEFLGKLYHIISIPANYPGKELKMEMYVGENNAFTSLAPPILGVHNDVAGYLVHDNLVIIAAGVFLFMFGISFLCVSLLFVAAIPEIKGLVVGALFCINLGVWLLAYYNVLCFFVFTPYETQIEYFCLFLIIPFCYALLYYIQGLQNNRMYMALMFICWGIPLFQVLLQAVFNIHLRVTLPLYHATGVLGFSIVIGFAIKNFREKNIPPASIVQMTGLVFFTVSEFTHLIIYFLDTLHVSTIKLANDLIIAIGCLIFAMCQLATYLIYITDSYAKRKENTSLSHLAYADGLTNLANRAKADQYMNLLDNGDDDYCIISIDLNGLKDVNDKFGHPAGDRYIRDFAKVLENTFSENDLCARVGGDEFVVILRDASDLDVDALLGRMRSALNVMNALYTEYQRSVATGYAYRHEFNTPTPHKVYMRADKRMYEEKRKMHEEMGVTTRL